MLKILALALLLGAVPAAASELIVVNGTQSDGTASQLWLDMLKRRLPATEFAAIATVQKPYTPQEAAWMQLIRRRATRWHEEIPALAELFAPVTPPKQVSIVLGNRGADDAFSHKPFAIGFDLAALQRVYGDAAQPGSGERLDRFFRHEYVHLLQHAWWQQHPYTMQTPLRHALAEIWSESLGNYFSLSQRWQSQNGAPSATARKTLAALEPRFVARLAALACTTPEVAQALTTDLSRGRFDRKWGALPPALWLEADTEHSTQALRAFIVAGPDGVWDLATRHLNSDLAHALEEARATAALCMN